MTASTAFTRLGYFITVAMVVACTLTFLLVIGPTIENRYFPVIRDGSLHNAHLNADGSIKFRAVQVE